MTEDECGEIEYLDEDEDIVQQYAHSILVAINTETSEDIETKITPLLIRRKPANKRKQKSEEEDSDYDPKEDIDYDFEPQRKRRRNPPRRQLKTQPQSSSQNTRNVSFTAKKPLQVYENPFKPKPVVKTSHLHKNEWAERKKLDIQIPDYEDALCLPVRALKLDEIDTLRLKQWNNLCLEHIRQGEKVLKTDRGETKSSTRTIVLRNVPNKKTGRTDTNIWSKTQVEDENGEKQSEIFQSVLPRYRERKLLTNYKLAKTPLTDVRHTYEVVLTKEDNKGEETLVAYKPKESVSAVYKLVGNKTSEDCEPEENPELRHCGSLREVASCKVCAPCYQLSWRGVRKVDNGNNIACAVCSRTFVSVYNLLTHLKAHHKHAEVRAHKRAIAKTLASVVSYHYKCRVCQKEFPGITQLRKHVFEHQGTEVFKCEIGNHMAS